MKQTTATEIAETAALFAKPKITKTAADIYRQKATKAQYLLKRIATGLSEHQARQVSEPTDWGYVGDLGHINEELAKVLVALGDLDELGLEY